MGLPKPMYTEAESEILSEHEFSMSVFSICYEHTLGF